VCCSTSEKWIKTPKKIFTVLNIPSSLQFFFVQCQPLNQNRPTFTKSIFFFKFSFFHPFSELLQILLFHLRYTEPTINSYNLKILLRINANHGWVLCNFVCVIFGDKRLMVRSTENLANKANKPTNE
jgi:hypothetical protein